MLGWVAALTEIYLVCNALRNSTKGTIKAASNDPGFPPPSLFPTFPPHNPCPHRHLTWLLSLTFVPLNLLATSLQYWLLTREDLLHCMQKQKKKKTTKTPKTKNKKKHKTTKTDVFLAFSLYSPIPQENRTQIYNRTAVCRGLVDQLLQGWVEFPAWKVQVQSTLLHRETCRFRLRRVLCLEDFAVKRIAWSLINDILRLSGVPCLEDTKQSTLHRSALFSPFVGKSVNLALL